MENMAKVFDMYRDAVVAAKDGRVVYYNAAAKKLMPQVDKLSPQEMFPDYVANCSAERFSGVVVTCGAKREITSYMMDDIRVFCIETDTQEQEALPALLTSISAAMADSLSVLKLAEQRRLEEGPDAETDEYIAMSNKAFYKLCRLSSGLSQLCGQLGAMESRKRNVDIVEVCAQVVTAVRDCLPPGSVDIELKSDVSSVTVFADRLRIQQMLFNLISNSLKHPAGNVIITVSLTFSGDMVYITVRDNGAGVAEDKLSTVWHRYTEQPDYTDAAAGLGIGLSIVQLTARAHGGGAVLESRPGAGTTVTAAIKKGPTIENGLRAGIDCYLDDFRQLILTEMSGVMETEKYKPKYLD